jgi:hypothetical protein
MNKKVDFKAPDTEKEDREREKSRLKKLMDERLKRPCTYMELKFTIDSVTETKVVRLRKNSFSPAFFLANDPNRIALNFDDTKVGWHSIIKAITRHQSNGNLSKMVRELAKEKARTNGTFASRLKKLATIYVTKDGDHTSPIATTVKKSNIEERFDNLKTEAHKMKDMLNESRNFLCNIVMNSYDNENINTSFDIQPKRRNLNMNHSDIRQNKHKM